MFHQFDAKYTQIRSIEGGVLSARGRQPEASETFSFKISMTIYGEKSYIFFKIIINNVMIILI